jgi:hypothetical protein
MLQVTVLQLKRGAPLMALAIGLGLVAATPSHAESIRGWISDEGCARGHASGGTFTGTNPDCARKCILNGARTVLIDSNHKRVLLVGNPAVLKENIGDYVEIQGALDSGSNLHVDSFKLIEKGVAKCDLKQRH